MFRKIHAFIKDPYYKKTKIAFLGFLCVLALCFLLQFLTSPSFHLKDFTTLPGKSEARYRYLDYTISSKLAKTTSKQNRYYLVSGERPYPQLSFYLYESDYYSDFVTEYTATIIARDMMSMKCKIDKTDSEEVLLDGVSCQRASWTMEAYAHEDLYSDELKAEALLIPTAQGVYVVSLQTYADDDNDYRFDAFLDGLEIEKLRTEASQAKEKQETIADYQSQLNHIYYAGSDEDQQEIIDDWKETIEEDIEAGMDSTRIESEISFLSKFCLQQVHVSLDSKEIWNELAEMSMDVHDVDQGYEEFERAREKVIDGLNAQESSESIQEAMDALEAIYDGLVH